MLRYVGVDALLRLSAAVLIGSAALAGINLVMPMEELMRPVPFGVLFIQALLVFLGASSLRLAMRVVLYLHATRTADRTRVLIVGAGGAGPLLLREIQGHPDLAMVVIGFLDDDRTLHGRTIGGAPVLGGTDDLPSVVASSGIDEVIVAMPSAPRESVRRILNAAAESGVRTRVMPHLVSARGSASLHDLRPIEVEDLLGRELTPIDVDEVRETVAGRVVAVTGAAGSIGAELCRQIITMGPASLLLLEIDESRLYELWLELEKRAPGVAHMCICDIRDTTKLATVFSRYRPELVLHAAAYKHVPLMELEPAEAVRTNVGGTLNVIDACVRHGAGRFVLISTDKAVAPVNVMGLTKRLAERAMLDATRNGSLDAVAVRFGNVLASRGSVVPIFEEQLRRGGPLTVTDPEVTRYFMTIPEASRLVLQAQAIGRPGDIFVLEMGEPVKIADLARKMVALSGVPAEVTYTGLRPGEKLHETLVDDAAGLLPTEREKILRVDRVDVPPAGFRTTLEELVRVAAEGDEERLLALLHVADPTPDAPSDPH
jgi:FlaA1/EpsC-like NDP-sugar epimerase